MLFGSAERRCAVDSFTSGAESIEVYSSIRRPLASYVFNLIVHAHGRCRPTAATAGAGGVV